MDQTKTAQEVMVVFLEKHGMHPKILGQKVGVSYSNINAIKLYNEYTQWTMHKLAKRYKAFKPFVEPIRCKMCGCEFEQDSARQRYCDNCRDPKNVQKSYYQKHVIKKEEEERRRKRLQLEMDKKKQSLKMFIAEAESKGLSYSELQMQELLKNVKTPKNVL